MVNGRKERIFGMTFLYCEIYPVFVFYKYLIISGVFMLACEIIYLPS